jgi:hypothetical protein
MRAQACRTPRLANLLVVFATLGTGGSIANAQPATRPTASIGQDLKFQNDKVRAVECVLTPGRSFALSADCPCIIVYLDAGEIELVPVSQAPQKQLVNRGDCAQRVPEAGAIRNVGPANLRLACVEYRGQGASQTWGDAGLAPDYKLLFESQYGRVYDIRMAAGKSEPQHSHHDRVVICLSGAELEHIMPDGRKEKSSLKTGEIAWRLAATHIGHNLGTTDLWVIAIEPK